MSVGVAGGSAPHGLKQRELKTLFLRAPYQDWAALEQGHKTEFRAVYRGAVASSVFAPTPVVLYAVSSLGRRVEKLMVLREHRRERLMDIADQPESLRCEGMMDYDHFRRYWRARTKRPFRAMQEIEVFQIGPWSDHDAASLGEVLLRRLYERFLPPDQRPLSSEPT